MATKREKTPVLDDLADRFYAALQKLGADAETARIHSRACAADVQAYMGGMQVYIPVAKVDLSERDRRIYAEFNGSNRQELCRKYRISEQRIYAIVRAMHGDHIKRNQADVFEVSNA